MVPPFGIFLETATTGTHPRPRRRWNGAAQDRTWQEPQAESYLEECNGSQSVPEDKKSSPNWQMWPPRRTPWSPPSTPALTVAQLTAMREEGARDRRVLEGCQEHPGHPRRQRYRITSASKDALVGPLLYAFSKEDPGAAGRLIKEFAKGNDKLQAQGRFHWWKDVPGLPHVDVLATLPTRDQALAMLVRVLAEPATMLVRVLSRPLRTSRWWRCRPRRS